jgi:hypothetical protein
MLTADHLYHVSSTPPARLWALLAVSLAVLATLLLNLWLTRQARARKSRGEFVAWQMSQGPEFDHASRR